MTGGLQSAGQRRTDFCVRDALYGSLYGWKKWLFKILEKDGRRRERKREKEEEKGRRRVNA